jgi:integrase
VKPAGRVRYLQPTELRTVLEACPEWSRLIAALAAATGMRRGGILGLRWMDVDFNGGRIMIPRTKNGEGRIVYFNTLAKDALEAVPRNKTKNMDCIFTGESRTPVNVSFAFLGRVARSTFQIFDSHRAAHPLPQRFANGGEISTPEPGLPFGRSKSSWMALMRTQRKRDPECTDTCVTLWT